MEEHDWPSDQTEHVWSPWKPWNRGTVWRFCIHPKCPATETKDVK